MKFPLLSSVLLWIYDVFCSPANIHLSKASTNLSPQGKTPQTSNCCCLNWTAVAFVFLVVEMLRTMTYKLVTFLTIHSFQMRGGLGVVCVVGVFCGFLGRVVLVLFLVGQFFPPCSFWMQISWTTSHSWETLKVFSILSVLHIDMWSPMSWVYGDY